MDGDGAPDILTTAGSATVGGGVYAWRYDGSLISGFPKFTEVDAQGPVTVADIDQDGQVELVASSDWDLDSEGSEKFRGSLYVWDVPKPHDALSDEWPHFHHDTQHTGLYRSPADLPPPKPTLTPTPIATATATSTPTPTPTPTKEPSPGDTDEDGCTDAQETGPSEALGGQRDYLNFWDFFDTPNPAGNVRDQVIDIGDIFRVVARFGTFGDENIDPLSTPPSSGYHTAFDRSASGPGGDPWNLGPPDGAIDGSDILLAVSQFGHSCL